MLTSALSVPFLSVHITAMMQTTALWSASWWAPMRPTLPWNPAPTASPSARSKTLAAASAAAVFKFSLTETKNPVIMISKVNDTEIYRFV